MNLTLTPDLEHRLEHLAAQTHRESSDLAQEGVARFLSYREGLERAVEEGRAAISRGDVLDHNQAMLALDDLLDEKPHSR